MWPVKILLGATDQMREYRTLRLYTNEARRTRYVKVKAHAVAVCWLGSTAATTTMTTTVALIRPGLASDIQDGRALYPLESEAAQPSSALSLLNRLDNETPDMLCCGISNS